MLFKGSGVAIVTPFKQNNLIDFERLAWLIEWHIKNATDAIIICGTTGESATLSKEEKMAAIEFTIKKVNGRIQVIAGTGSNNTQEALELSRYAESVGADGLLLVTPYYNKTTQRGLVEHFTVIAKAVNLPIILYNVPGRTGLNLLPSTVFELAKQPNIKAIKEASGDISQVAEIARLCGEDFYIYAGNDDQIIPIMSLGGVGVISVLANILPKETHDLCYYYLNGNIIEARRLQLKLNQVVHSLFIETNPIPVKTALNLMGIYVGGVRLPLVKMEQKNKEKLKKDMLDLGLTILEE